MNIVCSTDDNFVQHCSIMLCSVLFNNTDVSVFLLTEGLKAYNYKKLKEEVESKNGKFYYILVDSSLISDFPMPIGKNISHITQATYYRLLIPDILPKEIKKVIYLDCDIIVRKSLDELWKYDISDYAIGAVHQITNESEDAKRLNYAQEYGYFNAGVLLINLEYWRKKNISNLLFNHIVENFKLILFHDQDALNAVLYNCCFALPCKWNMLGFFFEKEVFSAIKNNEKLFNNTSYDKDVLINELKDPTVVHFVFKPKPWEKVCLHPYRMDYFKYAKISLYYNKISKPSKLLNYVYFIYFHIKKYLIRIKYLLIDNSTQK